MIATVNAALDPDDYAPSDHDLATAMQDYVKVNLSDLGLDASVLQAVFHCSRATVYRCFKRHAGVAAYIREQRLLRCFEQLTPPDVRTPADRFRGPSVGLREPEPL